MGRGAVAARPLVAAVGALALVAGGVASPRAGAEPPPRQRYIVVLEDNAGDPNAVAAEHSRARDAHVEHVYRHALRGYSAEMTPQQADAIAHDPRVDHVELDAPLAADAQTVPTGVARIGATPPPPPGGVEPMADVDIAIIDTGIDVTHPDLNVVATTKCTSASATAKTCKDDAGTDDNGHGSHVAGTAAARDNGIGVVGVAPGARLYGVKVLGSDGKGSNSWVIAGIDWVTAHADVIDVANMSLGGKGSSAAYRTAIQNSVARGVLYTVSAGNEHRDVYGGDGTFGTSDDRVPAAFPEVATISALADTDGRPGGLKNTSTSFSNCTEAKDDSFACFSNFSRSVEPNPVVSPGKKIDLMLPGYLIYSTYKNGGYKTLSGTSMAAPHAAGLAARYIAAHTRATDAAGVVAIRQALVDGGWEQTDLANGLKVQDDRDPNRERIGHTEAP